MSKRKNQRLDLTDVVSWLSADGMLRPDDAARIRPRTSRTDPVENHPLAIVAAVGVANAKPPHKTLTLEVLTTWMAERASLPYQRLDPLKIDMHTVTGVMSYNFAKHYNILCVSVHPDKIVVATAEPFSNDWENELYQAARKRIERVIANPLDISRYIVEFYALSRSMRGAKDASHVGTGGDLANLEQMVELGRRGKLDANDQHIVNIVDWLLQYAFEQRASDIHIEPRRDEGSVRFRIDGVLHLVYQMPTTVMAAVTSRVKILGRMDLAEKRRPLDGRLKTKTPDGKEVELRL
ncbi:MAG TPA: ATPase, T2SS/T4P/T4SS family, partial [Burkholderiales bacterium]|nr:ATPase, T2SS/T4P/T4SS family [Burkholderiales bacterium]